MSAGVKMSHEQRGNCGNTLCLMVLKYHMSREGVVQILCVEMSCLFVVLNVLFVCCVLFVWFAPVNY